MKLRFIASALLSVMLTATAAADPVDYIHPKVDKFSGECVVTSEGVTYHSMGYPSTPPTYYGGYVRFTSENEGDPVSITFTDFNCLRGDKPIVFVYDGDEILKTSFTSYSSAVPAGYLAAVTPDNAATELTAPSGVLCVLFAPASKSDFVTSPTGTISGAYTASVTAGVPKDMEFESAVFTNEGMAARRGMRNLILGTLTVKMDGTLNPLSLDRLSFDLSAVTQSGLVENIRLYNGSSVTSDALLGTLGEGASTLTVPAGELKSKNVFTIVADVKPDAAGTIPAPTVAALKVAGVDRNIDAATAAPLAIANEIWMTNGSDLLTYTIDGDANFYDMGGPAGIIPAGAKGSVTFVPATAGQKIKIDVEKLALFNTSSTGLNDVFRFYNGREATAENLVAELLKETKIVKSTADDGSLTVTFEVKQGNAGKDGWEAVVSQFLPGPMTLAGVDSEDTESTVGAAAETDIPLLIFDVRTDNQLNPLTLSSVSLANADGAASAAIGKVKVYSLGETATFSKSKLYAEGAPAGNTLALTGDCTLAEGHNYFAVAIDVAETALTGDVAGLRLASVKIGDADTTPAGDLTARITVDNTCRIAEGSHSHTMYGDWQFLSPAPTSSYSSNYPASTTDHVVTFIPTSDGSKAQIEFDSFDVYYASSSYGSKATFEVYSGTTATAANLIWKLSDNAHSQTGPGRKLRSTSADGAITVKFNPNATSTYYTGKGWTATVSQFTDHAAEVTAVDVAQASTAIVGPGAKNAELLAVNVITEGTLSPLTLDGVNVQLTGKEVVKAVNLLVAPEGELASATLWGTAVVPAEGTAVKIERLADVEATPLAEEHNRYFITVDLNDEIESDVAVDASLTSLEFAGGKNVAVENGNPEGVRLTKNIYLMESGEGHVVTVGSPIVVYDDGGPAGNVTKGFKGVVTFVPARENEVLALNAESFSIGSGRMYVYSGREVNEENILGKNYYYTTGGPENLLSKADDGSLTVRFEANSTSTTLAGFAMSVTPVAAEAMNVASVNVDDASADDIVRGSSDAPIARVTVNVAGNSGTLALSEMTVDFGGSTDVADILATRVFYTGATETFSPVQPLCEKATLAADGTATLTFAEPVTVDEAGAYNFWVTADLSATATPGNVASAKLTSLTANDAPAALPEWTTGERVMISGMGGTYRVGTSDAAKYHSLTDAVRALEVGVEGAVLFMIEDGEYKENLSIVDVIGTSAEHPVVFSSLSGDRDKVIISGASELDKQGMIYVENSSYIHFRNLTIAPNSTEYFAGIHFKDGSRHCSVENCVVKCDPITTNVSTGISLIRTEGLNEENRNCDYFTVKDSYIEGGYIALYLAGTGYVVLPKDKGLLVTGNTVSKAYFKGIYVTDCSDFEISGNVVTAGDSYKKSYNGIEVYRPTGAFRVTGNKVNVSQNADFTGLYIRGGGGSADAASPAVVANNAVTGSAATSVTFGIMYDASMTNLLLAHNSVNITGPATLKSVYALAFTGNAPVENATRIVNNVLCNATASGPLRPWNDTHYANMTFSGNVYYCPGDVIDTDGKTFAEYQAATGDNTSVWLQPDFFSATDLHLREADDSILFPRLDEVMTDAEGTDRNDPATAGAYEYAVVSVETPEIAEGYPKVTTIKDVSATVTTRWTVGGSLYAKAVKADAEAPSAEELKATRPVAIEADAENAYTFNFLEQLTDYKACFIVVSALGEESAVVVSEPFTTKETIEELAVEIFWDEEPLQAGESILLQAGVTGGQAPYTYEWLDQMQTVVGTDDTFVETASVNQTYRLRVASADGQCVVAKTHVPVVTESLAIATFDDLPLEAESNWKYDPLADNNTFIDAFFSGSFQFGNFPYVQWGAWSGYGYANETATEFVDYSHQFRNVVGGGAANTANYGVAYMMGADMTINLSAPDAGFEIPGVYVTNSACLLSSVLNGDGFSDKFTAENGDYMTLLFTGLNAGGDETATVEVPLADYRNATPELLTDWKWVDLSPLGHVHGIRLGYQSSKQATVPAYVCLDQLGATNPSSSVNEVEGNAMLSTAADGCLSILGVDGGYTLRVYTTDGVMRASHRLSGAATVSTDGLPTGVCLAEIVTDSGARSVLRFVNK